MVITNPAAGGDPLGLAQTALERGVRAAAKVEVRHTEHPGQAEEIAAELAGGGSGTMPDLVIAVGGDGTARDVAAGLYRAGAERSRPVPALLVAPGGTGNSSYLGIWQDRPWTEVLDRVLGDVGTEVRWLDLARVVETGRIVLLGAGSGLIAEALVTARDLPGRSGRDRYQRALHETVARWRPYPGRVTVDGEVLAEGGTLLVNIGGGRYRGGGYRLLPDSLLDDGLLDVCVCGDSASAAELAALAVDGRHVAHPAVRYGRGTLVAVERTDGAPLVFEHDGDLAAITVERFTVEVLAHSVPMVVPTPPPAGLSPSGRPS
ncbi:MAG: diacylglycerol kinase [Actinobacteria bacterium]|nr:diacylglycerol kinase [Actinomycetota bacterium]